MYELLIRFIYVEYNQLGVYAMSSIWKLILNVVSMCNYYSEVPSVKDTTLIRTLPYVPSTVLRDRCTEVLMCMRTPSYKAKCGYTACTDNVNVLDIETNLREYFSSTVHLLGTELWYHIS